MKKFLLILICTFTFVFVCQAQSYSGSNDTIDVLHYDIRLDMQHCSSHYFQGSCNVTLQLLQPASHINLGLEAASIDSVQIGSTVLKSSDLNYNHHRLRIPTQGSSVDDTLNITVFYRSSGWQGVDGGFWCTNTIFYNLGEDRYERPFSMGRSWFPCNDSVYDKATYSLQITVAIGWTAICSGNLDSTVVNYNTSNPNELNTPLNTTFYYTLPYPISTYQVGIDVAQYTVYRRNYTGFYGTYPAHMAYMNSDSTQVAQNFTVLDTVLPFLEQHYGPYRWDNIGYSGVTGWAGMEHVNNIAIGNTTFANPNYESKHVIVHEFAHQWFGNLVTCARIQDLWFNEGGATFAEQEAMGHLNNATAKLTYYMREESNNNMIAYRYGFRPLCGMPDEYSFQQETYYKGAMVIRELRHLLGDSLFYSSLQTLFSRNAFTALDSYQLRDSLSRYSGIDLTPFFDFHIFGNGFAEYSIDSIYTVNRTTTVWLSQHLWGSTEPCLQAKIPVTFFSATGDTTTRDMACNGTTTWQQFDLPFTPSFAVVNYIDEIADANMNELLTLDSKNTWYSPYSDFKVKVIRIEDTLPMVVSEHWRYPDEDSVPGVVRWANHRWFINGNFPSSFKGVGSFFYQTSRTGIDSGFCEYASSADSLRLFYRANTAQPWKMLSNAYRGNDNNLGSCFVYSNLKAGEYTLAIVDTNQLSISTTLTTPTFSLFPNPAHSEVTVELCNTNPSILSLSDATGRKLFERKLSTNTTLLNLQNYPHGIYFVSITTSSTTSTKKLIIK